MSVSSDDARVGDLFNTLRTGDHGVSLERFLGALYFLQHSSFSVLDARDAFVSSSASSERFLSYRDFQSALLRTARAMATTADSNASDAQLLSKLMDAVQQSQRKDKQCLDAIQRQLTKANVLAVLDQHVRQLVQSFQLYGAANDLTPRRLASYDAMVPMTLDGFVDFLNAYIEYEAFLSYQAIEQLAKQVVNPFELLDAKSKESEESSDQVLQLDFPQFLELFCRVASRFHVATLEREGAQLRKAVESCRLEFSLQLLLEKMAIKILVKDDHERRPLDAIRKAQKQDSVRAIAQVVLPNYDTSIEALSLDDPEHSHPALDTTTIPSIPALLHEISILLDTNKDGDMTTAAGKRQAASAKQQRPQSVLFARLPPRKIPSPASHSLDDDLLPTTPWDPPHVTLIREVVTPPQLPSNILKRLEYAMTYQNTGQFHMALGALHTCRSLYRELRENNSQDEMEVRVFFSLMDASVYDSARNDHRALAMYLDALRTAERLPLYHTGRALVKSSLGCMLFYLHELALAKQCHEHVLAFRRFRPDGGGDDHLDTATAMNNLACCLSQDARGAAIEDAYLYLKTAKRIYSERLGPTHPRVEAVARNFERVLASQRTVVVDAVGAIARGEYMHVIPGSRFQIKALVPTKADKGSGKKTTKKKGGKSGKKKK